MSPVALSWPTLRKAIAAVHLCFILPKHSRLPASPPLRCISAMLTAHASSSDAMCVAAMPVQKRCTQIAASLSTEATSVQRYLPWITAMCTASAGRTASALTQVDGRSVHSEFLTASFGFFPGFAINFQVKMHACFLVFSSFPNYAAKKAPEKAHEMPRNCTVS